MEYREELLEAIDYFNVNAVEEFKEEENSIIADSNILKLTRKKDYAGHISRLRKIKSLAQNINTRDIEVPESDQEAYELIKLFDKCLLAFSGVCDQYVRMQSALKDKAEGAKINFLKIKEINLHVNESKDKFNKAIHELDILYSEILELRDASEDPDETLADVEYKTYDSFL